RAAREVEGDPVPRVEGILAGTRRAFALLPRFAIAGCVALLAAYTIWLPAGFWGAVVGSFVVVQVSLVINLVRRSVLANGCLHRKPAPGRCGRVTGRGSSA